MKQIDKAYTYGFWLCGFIQRRGKVYLGEERQPGNVAEYV